MPTVSVGGLDARPASLEGRQAHNTPGVLPLPSHFISDCRPENKYKVSLLGSSVAHIASVVCIIAMSIMSATLASTRSKCLTQRCDRVTHSSAKLVYPTHAAQTSAHRALGTSNQCRGLATCWPGLQQAACIFYRKLSSLLQSVT
jgi:hypothetical protein